jgi:uncharacterized protein (TIGR03643 family)
MGYELGCVKIPLASKHTLWGARAKTLPVSVGSAIYKHMNMVEPVSLSADDLDRIIGMAWEDRTPFDAIRVQFGLTEQQVRNLMKANMKPTSYKMWRIRMEANAHLKHSKIREFSEGRYRSSKQKLFR